ncbi:mitochondrial 54S ribosome protein domain-containing protein [Schizosaccharomyces japonicus yFS275]|uniref:Large ribosomal subunit protein bL34m n=1 Tax=Schizosaccharomyces japonicus (strain yFS275 / FY16936) TaxID=402676 RepID=B6JVS9_SCHJY|nr:mitochondrial 54S ribosome protein domain-containing protein [Schizosaccharomyces japonicus yFS275]EEB05480.1 ribosomal protein subunit L34 [Schizosaccharomyces japonicus yFS275]
MNVLQSSFRLIGLSNIQKCVSGKMISSFFSKASPFSQTQQTPSVSPFGWSQQRWKSYGMEYQPSNIRRKRKHGFLSRIRTHLGRRILNRRKRKGRRYLSH